MTSEFENNEVSCKNSQNTEFKSFFTDEKISAIESKCIDVRTINNICII